MDSNLLLRVPANDLLKQGARCSDDLLKHGVRVRVRYSDDLLKQGVLVRVHCSDDLLKQGVRCSDTVLGWEHNVELKLRLLLILRFSL